MVAHWSDKQLIEVLINGISVGGLKHQYINDKLIIQVDWTGTETTKFAALPKNGLEMGLDEEALREILGDNYEAISKKFLVSYLNQLIRDIKGSPRLDHCPYCNRKLP